MNEIRKNLKAALDRVARQAWHKAEPDWDEIGPQALDALRDLARVVSENLAGLAGLYPPETLRYATNAVKEANRVIEEARLSRTKAAEERIAFLAPFHKIVAEHADELLEVQPPAPAAHDDRPECEAAAPADALHDEMELDALAVGDGFTDPREEEAALRESTDESVPFVGEEIDPRAAEAAGEWAGK